MMHRTTTSSTSTPVKCHRNASFKPAHTLCRASAANDNAVTRRIILSTTALSLLLQTTTPASISSASANAVERTQLGPDLEISRVIKGCWQLSGGHRGDQATDRTSGRAAIEDFQAFVGAGFTTFDAADHYGPAEALIGRYLQEHPEQRRNVQVLTKYCVFSGAEMARLNRTAVDRAVDVSRQRLGVDSIDLMQFYWGDYSYPKYVDAIKYLADVQADGKIKHIGVTNFDVPTLQRMCDTGVRIVSNQVQYSLLDRRPENYMVPFCKQGVQLLTYGTLAGGFLSNKYLGVPASKVRVDTYSKGKYARVIQEVGGWDYLQGLLQVLDVIGQKHNVSIANVATRWVLDKPQVAGVILGARNASHVQDEQRVFSFALDQQDLEQIDAVLAQGRQARGDCYSWERGEGSF